MRICNAIIGVGPDIGSIQPEDARICKELIGVGPMPIEEEESAGASGIIYGTSGLVSYGTSGVITY
jgi:hypothetical protein